MIHVCGMIGVGKTTLTERLAEKLEIKPFYENVEDSAILPKFYTSTKEELERNRYPFLLQMEFLSKRHQMNTGARDMEQTCRRLGFTRPQAILDRSWIEDLYFAEINHRLGGISNEEFDIYSNIRNRLELSLNRQRFTSDIYVILTASFETVLARIMKRNRTFELSADLEKYYFKLWKNYINWMLRKLKQTSANVLVYDTDEFDVLNDGDLTRIANDVKSFYK